jgi:hypothetical protein
VLVRVYKSNFPKMGSRLRRFRAKADARSCFGAEMISTVSGEERKGGCNSKKV